MFSIKKKLYLLGSHYKNIDIAQDIKKTPRVILNYARVGIMSVFFCLSRSAYYFPGWWHEQSGPGGYCNGSG